MNTRPEWANPTRLVFLMLAAIIAGHLITLYFQKRDKADAENAARRASWEEQVS